LAEVAVAVEDVGVGGAEATNLGDVISAQRAAVAAAAAAAEEDLEAEAVRAASSAAMCAIPRALMDGDKVLLFLLRITTLLFRLFLTWTLGPENAAMRVINMSNKIQFSGGPGHAIGITLWGIVNILQNLTMVGRPSSH
jgi:hypothetical protein